MKDEFSLRAGAWAGYWTQPDSKQHHRMEVEFLFHDGVVGGSGRDEVGEFVLEGGYDRASGACSWAKRYDSHSVQYKGTLEGDILFGEWRIAESPSWRGEFRLVNKCTPVEVDELLTQFRDRGESHGEGSFTWNLDRATALMPAHQLADSKQYILRLVASAVAAGATRFQVEHVKAGYRLSWDGRNLTRMDLESLFPSGLSRDPRLSELAIGLGAARSLYSTVELQSGGVKLRLTQEGLTFDEASSATDGTLLTLLRPGWVAWFQRLRGGDEMVLLSERCRYAALDLILPWGDTLLPPPLKAPVLAFGKPPALPYEILRCREGDPRMGCGYFVLDQSSSGSALVHCGVSYPLDRGRLGVSGFLIWWNDALLLDLSRSDFVRNAAFAEWQEWLKDEIALGLRAAFKQFPGHRALEAARARQRRDEEGSETQRHQRASDLHKNAEECLRHQDYRQALTYAREAARLNEFYLGTVSICHGLLGELEDAIRICEQVLEIHSEAAWAHSNLAEGLYLAGRENEALERVQVALKLNRKHARSMALKARMLADKHPKNARRLATEALAIDGCPASAWETIARCSLLLDEPEAARVGFGKFLELARPETLWENDLPERLEAAREQLRQLEKLG